VPAINVQALATNGDRVLLHVAPDARTESGWCSELAAFAVPRGAREDTTSVREFNLDYTNYHWTRVSDGSLYLDYVEVSLLAAHAVRGSDPTCLDEVAQLVPVSGEFSGANSGQSVLRCRIYPPFGSEGDGHMVRVYEPYADIFGAVIDCWRFPGHPAPLDLREAGFIPCRLR
jgi:hypothetical protein